MPAARCSARRLSGGGAALRRRSATTTRVFRDANGDARTQVSQISGKILRHCRPDPGPHAANAHRAQVLESGRVFFTESVAVVESLGGLHHVTPAVEDETGPAARAETAEPEAQPEEQRNLCLPVERAARIVPAVPGQRRGHLEAPPEPIGQPECMWTR